MSDNAMLNHACKSFEEDLVLFYYGENGQADRTRVEEHLKTCSGCRSFLDDLRRLLPQVAQEEERPQVFWDDYYRETISKLNQHKEKTNWWRDLLTPTKLWVLPAFGTVAIAVLAIGLVLGKGQWSFFSESPAPNIPEEILVDADQLEFFKSLDLLESLSVLEDQERKSSERESNQSRVRNRNDGVA